MTDTPTALAPEVLDAEKKATPEWRAFRQAGPDWGLPRGTFDGTLREITTLQRRDTGQWILRMLAKTDAPRERYALAWAELSNDPRDPYALTSRQTRALQKVAEALGILTPAPAEEIVDALARRVGKPVAVRIVHTPVGPRATLAKPEAAERVGGELLPPLMREEAEASTRLDREGDGQTIALDPLPQPEVALEPSPPERRPPTNAVDRAHAAQSILLTGLRATRQGLILAAQGCHELLEEEGWLALGYDSLPEYLASPEIGLSRSTFYDLANIHRRFVVEGGVPSERLASAEHSKLALALPAITAGKASPEEAVDDATALGFRDMREKYRDLMAEPAGPKGDGDGDEGPDEPAVCESCGRPL